MKTNKNKTIQKVNGFLGKVNEGYWAWFFKKVWPFIEKWCDKVTSFGEKYDEMPQSLVQKILLIFDGVIIMPILLIGIIITKNVVVSILLSILIACTLMLATQVKKEYINYNKNK